MKLHKIVPEGSMLPRFYGVAWVLFQSRAALCLPVPLNLVVALLRAVWLFMKHGWRPIPVNPRAAYELGLRTARTCNLPLPDMGVWYEPGSRPSLKRNHVDGPMLSMRDGRVRFISRWQRLLLALGLTNELKLERHYWLTTR